MKSMNLDKMFKKLETSHILAGIALVVLVWALMNYSNNKNTSNFAPLPSKRPADSNSEQVLQTSGSGSVVGATVSASASDLLPKDNNNSWGNVPAAQGLDNVNLLKAGSQYGINTVGSSLRNANLQLRRDPPISKKEVGPWNLTTMEADNTGLGCT